MVVLSLISIRKNGCDIINVHLPLCGMFLLILFLWRYVYTCTWIESKWLVWNDVWNDDRCILFSYWNNHSNLITSANPRNIIKHCVCINVYCAIKTCITDNEQLFPSSPANSAFDSIRRQRPLAVDISALDFLLSLILIQSQT